MTSPTSSTINGQWTPDYAIAWYAKQLWPVGCNYIPRTAVNQIEMWQAETFDAKTINQELGWAQKLGFNTLRVYLNDKVWEVDRDGFKKRLDAFLGLAQKHRMRVIYVIFDDCWNANSKLGKQPDPIPGVHNFHWAQTPGASFVNDPSTWGRLEKYVHDLLKTFDGDNRILLWDLYNEPGNSKQETQSLPLTKAVFDWARAVRPSQPLSVGMWNPSESFAESNAFTLENSDVTTFHNYDKPAAMESMVRDLAKYNRPIICTEYMCRPQGSTFATVLPILKQHRVGAISWGLVWGRTNTIFSWASKEGEPIPEVWFHDIFRPDGTVFDPAEIPVIQSLTR
jgi:endo-1,4-beta-mannosidase